MARAVVRVQQALGGDWRLSVDTAAPRHTQGPGHVVRRLSDEIATTSSVGQYRPPSSRHTAALRPRGTRRTSLAFSPLTLEV
jgi:hypothetical protein